MAIHRFIIKSIAVIALAVLPFAAGGLFPAAAKHVPGPEGRKIDTLMANLRIQPLASVELPEFSLPDIKGKNHSIKDLAGKVLLLNFWTTF